MGSCYPRAFGFVGVHLKLNITLMSWSMWIIWRIDLLVCIELLSLTNI